MITTSFNLPVDLHVNDTGSALQVTVLAGGTPINLTGSSGLQLYARKPDDSLTAFPGQFVTDGSNGQFQYVTKYGDLNQYGIWSLQGFYLQGSGQFYTDVQPFRVYRNLNQG